MRLTSWPVIGSGLLFVGFLLALVSYFLESKRSRVSFPPANEEETARRVAESDLCECVLGLSKVEGPLPQDDLITIARAAEELTAESSEHVGHILEILDGPIQLQGRVLAILVLSVRNENEDALRFFKRLARSSSLHNQEEVALAIAAFSGLTPERLRYERENSAASRWSTRFQSVDYYDDAKIVAPVDPSAVPEEIEYRVRHGRSVLAQVFDWDGVLSRPKLEILFAIRKRLPKQGPVSRHFWYRQAGRALGDHRIVKIFSDDLHEDSELVSIIPFSIGRYYHRLDAMPTELDTAKLLTRIVEMDCSVDAQVRAISQLSMSHRDSHREFIRSMAATHSNAYIRATAEKAMENW